MYYDYSCLLGDIIKVFGTRGNFAKAMGLSERSISLKLNGKNNFKQKEIEKACEILNIPTEKIPLYFFATKVQ